MAVEVVGMNEASSTRRELMAVHDKRGAEEWSQGTDGEPAVGVFPTPEDMLA